MRKRSYKYFKPSEFIEAVKQISWLELYLCEDVDIAVKLPANKLTFIVDTMAPMRTVQVRKKYAPWLSSTTIDLIKERDKAQKKAAASNNSEDWKNFKKH